MKHKKLFISLTAVLAVLVFFGIFIMMWFVGDSYPDFKRFRSEFEIAGLDDGATPQGLACYHGDYKDGVDSSGNPIVKKQEYFLTSAYMLDGSPSRIYVNYMRNVTDESGQQVQITGYVGYVTMLNIDGTSHTGHVGGIATNGARLWVTYGDSILVARSTDKSYSNILEEIVEKAKLNRKYIEGYEDEESEGDAIEELEEPLSIQFTASFKANCNAAYLYYYHDPRYNGISYDRLYVGEFYRKGNYETDKSHRLTTPEGYKNTSFMYEYRPLETDNEYGLYLLDNNGTNKNISENVPRIQKIYSLPEKIQGLAFSGRSGYGTSTGIMVLSQSYGLANSHLLCFDWNKVNTKGTKFTAITGHSFAYDGVSLKVGELETPYTDDSLMVYYADKNNSEMYLGDYSIPSMSEGMCTLTVSGYSTATQDRVFVLFESGSKKYGMFTRENIRNIYSFIPRLDK